MGDIQRQRSERLRQAVQLAASGEASRSLPLLDRVLTVPDQFSVDEHGQKTRDSSARYPKTGQPGILPISRSTWYEWVKQGIAPPGMRIGGRTVVWRLSDIQAMAKPQSDC